MSATPDPGHVNDRLAGTRWRLDPSGSSAGFRVPNFWGLVTVKGSFERLEGELEVDEDGHRRMQLVLDATSLDTGNRKRDRHLRSADFFDAERHPEVRFHSTRITKTGDGRLAIEGELEAAGQRVSLGLDATVHEADGYLEIEASTSVDQRELGMTWSPLGMAKSPSSLTVHALLAPES